MNNFNSFGLSPALLRALVKQGYTQPTPIQAAAIPVALEGHDLMASAQTGTGKTAGFALPVLERLFPQGKRSAHANSTRPRALVLTPTRELAAQVHESMHSYGTGLGLRSAAIFGGVGMGRQIKQLRRGLDVVIATPGRLIDHMQQGNINLSSIEILVLDEADRMLDMGFLPALRKIVSTLPKKRQTLLFSATFASNIKMLAKQFMREPKEVQVTPANTVVKTVSHRVYPVDREQKRHLLVHLLSNDGSQALVFARTKHGSDKLCKYLNKAGLASVAIHGNKSQNQRTRALADFKKGKVSILVATDIAARGLDIEQLPLVINHDLPNVAEDYIHRIGRTGRAGSQGLAISLVSHEEAGLLRDIQRLLKQNIEQVTLEAFVPSTPLRLDRSAPKPKRGQRTGRRKSLSANQRRPFAGRKKANGNKQTAKRHYSGSRHNRSGAKA